MNAERSRRCPGLRVSVVPMSTCSRRQALGSLLAFGGVLPQVSFAQAASPALSERPEIAQALPEARVQGQGRLRFLGLSIYDARLWAAAPAVTAQTWVQRPLALELHYLRHLKGPLIAERSITEIRRQGSLSAEQERPWLSALQNLIPDVQDGDRLVGLWQPDRGMTLFFNGQSRGSLSDLTLSQRFMGIWLSAKTSEPELRHALLGGGAD
jgi:Chalcone isomerase-like